METWSSCRPIPEQFFLVAALLTLGVFIVRADGVEAGETPAGDGALPTAFPAHARVVAQGVYFNLKGEFLELERRSSVYLHMPVYLAKGADLSGKVLEVVGRWEPPAVVDPAEIERMQKRAEQTHSQGAEVFQAQTPHLAVESYKVVSDTAPKDFKGFLRALPPLEGDAKRQAAQPDRPPAEKTPGGTGRPPSSGIASSRLWVGESAEAAEKKIFAHGGRRVTIPLEPMEPPPPASPSGNSGKPVKDSKAAPTVPRAYELGQGHKLVLFIKDDKVVGMQEEQYPDGPAGRQSLLLPEAGSGGKLKGANPP